VGEIPIKIDTRLHRDTPAYLSPVGEISPSLYYILLTNMKVYIEYEAHP
jgi:hypothetical protein